MLSASHKDTFSGVGWRSRRTRPARLTQEAEGCDYGRVVVSQSKPRVPGFFFWRELLAQISGAFMAATTIFGPSARLRLYCMADQNRDRDRIPDR